ncbi:hypothetical protein [Vibrio sp. LaRot3]|uniref:hypothetical protein n=1 Tax=Vibrio sp. LaRot3 TaxID=2998829 RepID=UPI0022CE06CF|nr:hypothetical protein [Vibrio sp. LaRot3]MDA0148847.1 hypothetical protein [Vibrio sp. LaRot3]
MVLEFDDSLDVGALGESTFDQWCRAGKITSIPSEHDDKHGWDFLVEFPYVKSKLPDDLRPKPIECKVQVKSTQGNKGAWDIKLSALKRLIDYTSPAFILFYEFSKAEPYELNNAYLVHIDEQLIYRTLKKIRENSGKKPLHLDSLSVSYRKHHINELSGKALREKIASYIPDGIENYQKEKIATTKRVGYEDGGIVGKFTAKADDIEQYCLDIILGKESSLELIDFSTKDNRFNIEESSFTIHESNGGTLTMDVQTNVLGACRIDFKKGKYAPPLSFTGEILSYPALINKPNTFFIRTKLFTLEFDITPKNNKLKTYFTADKIVTLDEATKWLRLFCRSQSEQYSIFEIHSDLLEMPWEGEITLPTKYTEDYSELRASLEVLVKTFELDKGTTLYLGELTESRSLIKILDHLVNNRDPGFEMEEQPEDKDGPERVFSITPVFLRLGSTLIGCIARFFANKINNRYVVDSVETLECYTFPTIPDKELLENLVKQHELDSERLFEVNPE